MQRLDGGGTKHIGGLERQLEQIVFGLALDPRPHQRALFRRVATSPGDIDEHHARIEFGKRFRRRQRDVIGQTAVALLAHAERRDAEAEETCVEPRELGFDRRKIEEIVVQDFAQLGVPLPGRTATDREHAFNARVEQAFAQATLSHHSGCAKQNDFHLLMNASRSALIVAASVVGMPCGKPL